MDASTRHPDARTLVYSIRDFDRSISRTSLYEFQNVVADIEGADMLAPGSKTIEVPKRIEKVVDRFGFELKQKPTPDLFQIDRDYDVFFTVVQSIDDVAALKKVPRWASHFKKKILLISDVWRAFIKRQAFAQPLREFDIVCSYGSGALDVLQDELPNTEVMFLPGAVDTLSFAPGDRTLPRTIDVYSMGRKSDETHAAFLKWAKDTGRFYLCDVLEAQFVHDTAEYRAHSINLARRSKYFIAYRGLVNRPEVTQHEIGVRFFEGAAAGCILLGEAPENEHFPELFDWPDPIVHLPYGSTEPAKVIAQLEEDPARLAKMRQNNIGHSLGRHDIAHRWRDLMDKLGLPLRQSHVQRLDRLEKASAAVLSSDSDDF